MASWTCPWTLLCLVLSLIHLSAARAVFEKLTGLDYGGTVLHSISNVSLVECHRRCSDEQRCSSFAFSFVLNPLAPVQETMCHMYNHSDANDPSALPQRAINSYYFNKLKLNADKNCGRRGTFERVPNKLLNGYDTAQLFTSSKEACLAACLKESRFVCRSLEYNYATLKCILSEYDRRSQGALAHFVDTRGIDYYENLCNQGDEACSSGRNFVIPQFGIPAEHVAHHVDLNYWTDKSVIATSIQACRRACEIERDFMCRSYLYKAPASGLKQRNNCQLYHVDHLSFPDGAATLHLDSPMPLIDSGDKGGSYYELVCAAAIKPSSDDPVTPPSPTRTNQPNLNCDRFGVCYEVGVSCKDTRIVVRVKSSRPFNGRVYALGRSETCNVDVRNRDNFYLDLTMDDQDCNTQSLGGVYTNTIVIQHHSVVVTKADKLYKIRCTYDISSKNITFGLISVGDPQTINVTSSPEAPSPKILIMAQSGREAEAVRIGDKLTFRIEIPPNSPYGIFARSCVAMAKDSRSTFQLIDDDGCPVDEGIFPQFTRTNNALESVYEAFRFTESYGVIFQCNVKYCLGPCEPVNCSKGRQSQLQSFGRKRRSVWGTPPTDRNDTKDMTLSQEILVLDFDDANKKVQPNKFSELDVPLEVLSSCPTRSSVLALAVTCGLLLLLYVCTIFCFGIRRVFVNYKH